MTHRNSALDGHFVYGPGIMGSWTHSAGPDTALWHELHHELGERVSRAQEDEDLGYGALFDLSYQNYMETVDRFHE